MDPVGDACPVGNRQLDRTVPNDCRETVIVTIPPIKLCIDWTVWITKHSLTVGRM